MSQLLEAIDIYCERTGPEFWSEPLNALTNLAFVAAGLWGVRAVRSNDTGGFAMVLAWWVVAIGIGSGLFHTFANRLTIWADILPIAGFTFAYTIFNLRRFLGMGWGRTIAIFIAFYAAAGLITWSLPAWLDAATNGTIGYLPAWLALFFFGSWLVVRGHPAGWYNLAAAAIFIVSAAFRTIDGDVCSAIPTGTHFLWHTLNGLMLGVLLAATARHGRRPPPVKGAGEY
ncbi:ceramidase [Nitratireductor mangrovi]|uniref:Ceramidase n=1 Tax=Nitratireductor mangrovi TaxID=2599600 RepID=A0A5B8KX37_9HYPH|nr:ceramidase [Nitratireductor mangrovi]QDZ00090.1 ceramidase [Nitratireductor mangrovi]